MGVSDIRGTLLGRPFEGILLDLGHKRGTLFWGNTHMHYEPKSSRALVLMQSSPPPWKKRQTWSDLAQIL